MSTKKNDNTNTGVSEKSIDQKVDELDIPEDDVDLDILINLGTGVSRDRCPGRQAARRVAFDKVVARGKPRSK